MNNGPISDYRFAPRVPEGDVRERHVCETCHLERFPPFGNPE